MRRSLCIALLLAAHPLQARADGSYEGSFPVAAVQSYLPQGTTQVLVARAGPPSDALTAAATALINAVKGAGVAQVLDDTDLGDTSNASDAELVPRAAKLGAQLVMVVRVSGEQGEAERAVVTLHDAQGKQLAILSVVPGQPLAARGASPTPTPTNPPAATNPRTTPAPPQQRPAPRVQRDELGFATFPEPSLLGTIPVEAPYEGLTGRRLSMPEFFERVGRPDLADRYVNRASVRDSLIVGGVVVVVLGLATSVGLLQDHGNDCGVETCGPTHGEQVAAAVVASGSALLGGGLVLGGMSVDPMPVTMEQARELARGHNAGRGAAELVPAAPRVRLALHF